MAQFGHGDNCGLGCPRRGRRPRARRRRAGRTRLAVELAPTTPRLIAPMCALASGRPSASRRSSGSSRKRSSKRAGVPNICGPERDGHRPPLVVERRGVVRKRLRDVGANAIDVDVQFLLAAGVLRIDRQRDRLARQRPAAEPRLDQGLGLPAVGEHGGRVGRKHLGIFDPRDLPGRNGEHLRDADEVLENRDVLGRVPVAVDRLARLRAFARIIVRDAAVVDDPPERVGIGVGGHRGGKNETRQTNRDWRGDATPMCSAPLTTGYGASVQSSRVSPGMSEKSEAFAVTSVQPDASACAPISRSKSCDAPSQSGPGFGRKSRPRRRRTGGPEWSAEIS